MIGEEGNIKKEEDSTIDERQMGLGGVSRSRRAKFAMVGEVGLNDMDALKTALAVLCAAA